MQYYDVRRHDKGLRAILGKGRERKGRERKGKEGKGRKGKRRGGRGREGKGREGKRREEKGRERKPTLSEIDEKNSSPLPVLKKKRQKHGNSGDEFSCGFC